MEGGAKEGSVLVGVDGAAAAAVLVGGVDEHLCDADQRRPGEGGDGGGVLVGADAAVAVRIEGGLELTPPSGEGVVKPGLLRFVQVEAGGQFAFRAAPPRFIRARSADMVRARGSSLSGERERGSMIVSALIQPSGRKRVNPAVR